MPSRIRAESQSGAEKGIVNDDQTTSSVRRAHIRLIDAQAWQTLTGGDPPSSPIEIESYTRAGLPWFDIYDENEPTLAPAAPEPPRTIKEQDRSLGNPSADQPIDVNTRQITIIDHDKTGRAD